MTLTEVLARVAAAGVRLRVQGDRILVSPGTRLTEELSGLIRTHKAELLVALTPTCEPAHADGDSCVRHSVPERGTVCMSCANLVMRVEHHQDTRRIFFWRCQKGHELMEGRNFGERVMLAPPECETAGDYEQWKVGQR